MPTWNDILEEINAAGGTHDVVRRKYLQNLHEQSSRNVIIYYSGWLQKPGLVGHPNASLSITEEDKNGFMTVIHGLENDKGLDLILHTPGGELAATESLVIYLRSIFGNNIRAIIPQIAMSGGTIIALSCKKIVMGKQSSIGPIDPQIGGLSAEGLIDEFYRISKFLDDNPKSYTLWQPILSQIRPGFITECLNVSEWSKKMAGNFLTQNMLRSKQHKEDLAKKIVERLSKKETYSHNRQIGFDEAKEIFSDGVEALEKYQGFQDAVLTLHHSTVLTLGATNATKIIENHYGRAFIKQYSA